MGVSENKIESSVIEDPKNSAGWIHTVNRVGYRVSDGRVVEMVLSQDETRRMGLLREDEIIVRFGEPDRIEEGGGLLWSKNYFYIDRGLIVRYGQGGPDAKFHINIIGK